MRRENSAGAAAGAHGPRRMRAAAGRVVWRTGAATARRAKASFAGSVLEALAGLGVRAGLAGSVVEALAGLGVRAGLAGSVLEALAGLGVRAGLARSVVEALAGLSGWEIVEEREGANPGEGGADAGTRADEGESEHVF